MRITAIEISNFRGLSNIQFDLTCPTSVIVGPNAVGKSSIFEAIRLLKVILAPSHATEAQEVLNDLKAWSHATSQMITESVFGDTNLPLRIRADIDITDQELRTLNSRVPMLAMRHVRNIRGVSDHITEIGLVHLLSSPEGQSMLSNARKEVEQHLAKLVNSRQITLDLSMDAASGDIKGANLLDQEMATELFRSVPATHTYISYFPADRALPAGEIPLQIGMQDMAQHSRSHITLPATKYARFKNFIVNRFLISEDVRQEIRDDFALIFKELLQDKEFHAIEVSQHGLLSAKIKEIGKNKMFDIDNMSSGEKGLLLIFLTMRRTIVDGGIVLIDEPELHLNSSIQKKLLPFLIKHVIEPANIQAIICTHSAEILSGAYERDNCSLFHLRAGNDITPVMKKDKEEVFEALKRLGIGTDDVLFNRGTIYVEGDHDIELLEAGFPARLHGFKLSKLNGRNNFAKEILNLQEQERKKLLDIKQCFVIDLDRKPETYNNTEMVKVEQWKRYCLENYLLESNTIYDVCKELGTQNELPSRGEMKQLLKDLALRQLKAVVAEQVYKDKEPENAGFRPTEIEKLKGYDEIAEALSSRIKRIQEGLATFDDQRWKKQYNVECEALEDRLKVDWDDNWEKLANGKHVLSDLHKVLGIKSSALNVKKKIMMQMHTNKTENWMVIDSILAGLVG